jgi:hypothetical protein
MTESTGPQGHVFFAVQKNIICSSTFSYRFVRRLPPSSMWGAVLGMLAVLASFSGIWPDLIIGLHCARAHTACPHRHMNCRCRFAGNGPGFRINLSSAPVIDIGRKLVEIFQRRARINQVRPPNRTGGAWLVAGPRTAAKLGHLGVFLGFLCFSGANTGSIMDSARQIVQRELVDRLTPRFTNCPKPMQPWSCSTWTT